MSKHDDRKGHHYYTSASQADACVYSSDDPCGHHAHPVFHIDEAVSSMWNTGCYCLFLLLMFENLRYLLI
jgi:hypothetical protein